jgi:predicted nuclease of predicted toxin-antitoxin system
MAIKLYLDEDVDPLLAEILRDRGLDCTSTHESGNRGHTDFDQLVFATRQERAILTFNVKDFVPLAQEFVAAGRNHSGIIVSDHLPFRELLRRILILLHKQAHDDLTDKLLWLQDYKNPESSTA